MNTEVLGVIAQIVLMVVLSYPLGKYIAKVYKGEKTWSDFMKPVERVMFKLSGIQNYIGPIAVCGLEGGIDQRVHDLLQLQQPLRVIVDLLQRNTLPNQRPFDFTAEFFGEIQALGGQAIQVTDQVVLCVFQLQLHHLMELLIVLRKGPGNGQKEDHRRKNYQDHGHPVEHQFSLHAHALLFGKGIQCPQLL